MEAENAPAQPEVKLGEEAAKPQAQAAQGGLAPSPTYAFAPPEDTYIRDTFAPAVPPLALGAIAFAIVGLIIWAGLRMTQAAGSRNRYVQAMNHEMADNEPAPSMGGGPVTQAPRARTVYAPPAFNRALITGPFLGDENRKAAKDSLRPLHALIALIRKYDANGLWSNAPSDSAPTGGTFAITTPAMANVPGLPPGGGVAPVTFPGAPGVVGAGSSAVNQTRGATFQGGVAGAGAGGAAAAEKFSDTVDHIHGRTEALATQVDMTATPETYPAPLRGNVKAISQELRAYLKDAEIAPTQDAATRSALRQKATQRLANADQMLTYMEGVVDGTADANHPPLFVNSNPQN